MIALGLGSGAVLLLTRPQPLRSRPPAPRDPDHLPIGMNLATIADYEPGFPFKNRMWGARPWMTKNATPFGPWNTEQITRFEFDADGYPLEAPIRVTGVEAPQLPFTILPNTGKPGRYVVLHDGVGEFEGLMGTRVESAKPGRVVIRMTMRGDDLPEGLIIRRSKRGDHLRNIRVVALDHEHDDLAADPFLPEFLTFCAPFHCLRFMDWGATNGSIEEEWADRKRPTFYTMVPQTGDVDGLYGRPPDAYARRFAGGVAIEVMIALANRLKIDPWFCIPHRASDAYIRDYARLVRARLDPSLKVYLEFSNEVWNFAFLQSTYVLHSRLAGDLLAREGQSAWDDAAHTKGGAFQERIGAMFRRTFAIWEGEWTGADRRRLVRVCGVQAGWPDAAKRTLTWCAKNGGADVVSATAYFGPWDKHYAKWAAAGAGLTADDVIADMREVVARQGAGTGLVDLAALAREHGMGYVSYEGGQHIQPKDQAEVTYAPALKAAQSHPGMYDLYIDNLRQQHRFGSDLMCAFNSVGRQGTRWGSWGHKSAYAQPLAEAPKMRALLDFNMPKGG